MSYLAVEYMDLGRLQPTFTKPLQDMQCKQFHCFVLTCGPSKRSQKQSSVQGTMHHANMPMVNADLDIVKGMEHALQQRP